MIHCPSHAARLVGVFLQPCRSPDLQVLCLRLPQAIPHLFFRKVHSFNPSLLFFSFSVPSKKDPVFPFSGLWFLESRRGVTVLFCPALSCPVLTLQCGDSCWPESGVWSFAWHDLRRQPRPLALSLNNPVPNQI
ncbi:hypothetical protein BDW71DRAFT_147568 [Aspergillus fruticulosus]